MSTKCPVCLNPIEPPSSPSADYIQVECPRCGQFELTGTARVLLPGRIEDAGATGRARLSYAIRTRSDEDGWPWVGEQQVRDWLQTPLPNPDQQEANLLIWMARQVGDDYSAPIEIPAKDQLAGVIGVLDKARVGDVINVLHREGIIEIIDDNHFCITKEGWKRMKNPFENMLNDRLTFVKSDGTGQVEGIEGVVTGGKVITFQANLPVEPGDRFLREVPSGLLEEYIVEDPGFHAGLEGIPAHFQSRVRRGDVQPRDAATIIANFSGANARLNFNSTDSSTNISVEAENTQLFSNMRSALAGANIADEQKREIGATIDAMEQSEDRETLKEHYQRFMSIASDHITVFSPFLAALAALL